MKSKIFLYNEIRRCIFSAALILVLLSGSMLFSDKVQEKVSAAQEIEDIISSYPGVKLATVIGVPHEKWGEAVIALVVPKSGTTLVSEDIITYCKNHLARYKVPKVVEIRDDLPLTTSGKVSKREVREEYWAGKESKI